MSLTRATIASLLVQSSFIASVHGWDDPCALERKPQTNDRRVFAEVGSGFVLAENRPLPYAFTPRITGLVPLDAVNRWSLSPSVAARLGDRQRQWAFGAQLLYSIGSGTSPLMPAFMVGLGPELAVRGTTRLDAVAELVVDLTPVLLGGRVTWGPIKSFSRPARLETFIGWRVLNWRRWHTPIQKLLTAPRRRFRPYADPNWATDYRTGISQLSISDTPAYLSLVQQLMIRLGVQLNHRRADCGNHRQDLESARTALGQALRQPLGVTPDVRDRLGLESLVREYSNGFPTAVAEGLAYAFEAESYEPDQILLAPAMMHAMNCVLDGIVSSSCWRH